MNQKSVIIKLSILFCCLIGICAVISVLLARNGIWFFDDAVLLAARENAASEKSMSDLQTILNDLMLNTKLHESDRLAHEVQGSMVRQIKKKYKTTKNLGVKQAPFYVLIGAEMPAILIETGFITNSTDKKRLLSNTYHEGVADGIAGGIKTYTKTIEQTFPGG